MSSNAMGFMQFQADNAIASGLVLFNLIFSDKKINNFIPL